MAENKKPEEKRKLVSRRSFLIGGGAVIAAGALTACAPKTVTNTVTETLTKTSTTTSVPPPVTKEAITTTLPPTTLTLPPATVTATTTNTVAPTYPASKSYLVVDSNKCAGCLTCMFMCSMVHEGKSSLSLSRIQIFQTPTLAFPDDLTQYQCRQCTDPLCVKNCPVGACYIDTANGNVRVIDQTKCIGCGTCIKMCPHAPHRTIWDASLMKSTKCDLCTNAPYFTKPGGIGPQQACILNCPMSAISVVTVTPDQTDDSGYDINLRKSA